MFIIFILIIILVIFYISGKYIENFSVYWSGGFIPGILPQRNLDGTYRNMPFGTIRTGQTTNMSYDLRNDPLIILKYPSLFNYSTLTPTASIASLPQSGLAQLL